MIPDPSFMDPRRRRGEPTGVTPSVSAGPIASGARRHGRRGFPSRWAAVLVALAGVKVATELTLAEDPARLEAARRLAIARAYAKEARDAGEDTHSCLVAARESLRCAVAGRPWREPRGFACGLVAGGTTWVVGRPDGPTERRGISRLRWANDSCRGFATALELAARSAFCAELSRKYREAAANPRGPLAPDPPPPRWSLFVSLMK